MSRLENRPNTALLVVDVQNRVVKAAHERDAVVANIGSLVEKARREQVPVLWVQHSDEQLARESNDWQIVPELTPGDAETLLEKNFGDSFEDTPFETALSDLGVGRLVIVGAQTDACIRSTIHGAFVRGYDVTLVSDAHTTEDRTAWGAPPPDQVIAHTNLYWTYQTAPGQMARTVKTKDFDFGGRPCCLRWSYRCSVDVSAVITTLGAKWEPDIRTISDEWQFARVVGA
jgi:Isochorismatase family